MITKEQLNSIGYQSKDGNKYYIWGYWEYEYRIKPQELWQTFDGMWELFLCKITDFEKFKELTYYEWHDLVNHHQKYLEREAALNDTTAEYKITKGSIFLCIKDYEMESGAIAYTNGKEYLSEVDNMLTDNDLDIYHDMGGERDFFEHFRQLTTNE